MPGGYGTDESLPWSGSSSSGSSTSYEPYSGNSGSDDYGIGGGGEFGTGHHPDVVIDYDPWVSSVENLPDEYVYEGNYVPTFGNSIEDFKSAYGGLSYDWVDPNSDFFTDTYGNQIGKPGLGLWNPFIAGYDPKTGKPIPLTTSQFNEMMSVGEFGILPPGGSSSGGPGPHYGGGYGGRRGGSGGGGGGGGSRMQYPGSGDAGGMRGRWGQPTIQGDYIRRMRGYNRGGIVSLC